MIRDERIILRPNQNADRIGETRKNQEVIKEKVEELERFYSLKLVNEEQAVDNKLVGRLNLEGTDIFIENAEEAALLKDIVTKFWNRYISEEFGFDKEKYFNFIEQGRKGQYPKAFYKALEKIYKKVKAQEEKAFIKANKEKQKEDARAAVKKSEKRRQQKGQAKDVYKSALEIYFSMKSRMKGYIKGMKKAYKPEDERERYKSSIRFVRCVEKRLIDEYINKDKKVEGVVVGG